MKMVAVPLSAFEMYNQIKENKKKSKKAKQKDKVKITPMVSAELRKVVTDLKKVKDVEPEPKAEAQPTKPINEAAKQREKLSNNSETLVTLVQVPKKKKERSNDANEKLLEDSAVVNGQITEDSSNSKKKKLKKMKKDKDVPERLVPEISTSPNESSPDLKRKRSPIKSLEDCSTKSSEEKPSKAFKVSKKKRPTSDKNDTVSLSSAENSIETAEKFFSWMMDPVNKEDFLSLYWEKKPVHISREQNRDYYRSLLSTGAIDDMLRRNNIRYGKNVDITSYSDGKRETLNPAGRAHAAVVWDYYRNGCSVRLLNPQTYHPQLRELNTRLQEVFGSFVGSNAYLTPPNSQGFAPHYDDIEAFVLQVEGSKMWRVYAPRDDNEKLPRSSSLNFSQEEIGEPILEVHVKAGDLLYFPRGFIHQATTVPGEHSLHVTVSTYQRNSWADLLEKLVPAALTIAIEDDVEFRKGMPLDVMSHIGAVHSESESPEREAIMKKLKKLFSKLFDYAPVDAAADQLAKDHIHDLLPPCLSSDEQKCSVLKNSERMVGDGKLSDAVVMSPQTHIRLTRSNVLRLVSEEEPDLMKIYHSMENSFEYHGEELQCIEIPIDMAPAVEDLIHSYPEFIAVGDLSLDTDADKVQIATELWERGLVLTERPLPQTDGDEDD